MLELYKDEKEVLKKKLQEKVKSGEGFCILVTGKWGVGKTTLVKEVVLTQKKDYLYLSLYPITSLDELKEQLFLKNENLILRTLQDLFSAFKKTPIPVSLDSKFLIEKITDKLTGKIIIFDDLERSKINKQVLLGFIEKLKQQGNVIILIANIDRLETELKENFEKIVNYHIQLHLSKVEGERIINYFFGECKACSKAFFYFKTKNLRIIKNVANSCCKLEEFLKESLKNLKEEHLREDIIFDIVNQTMPFIYLHEKYSFSPEEIEDILNIIKHNKTKPDEKDLLKELKDSKGLKEDSSKEILNILRKIEEMPIWVEKFIRIKEIPKHDLKEVLEIKTRYKTRELIKKLLLAKNLEKFLEEEVLPIIEENFDKLINKNIILDLLKIIKFDLYEEFCKRLVEQFKQNLNSANLIAKIKVWYKLKFCENIIPLCSKYSRDLEYIKIIIQKDLEKVDNILEFLKSWDSIKYEIEYFSFLNRGMDCENNKEDREKFLAEIKQMFLNTFQKLDEENIAYFLIRIYSIQYQINTELYAEVLNILKEKYKILNEIENFKKENNIDLIDFLLRNIYEIKT